MDEILQIINTTGFPIFTAIIMFKLLIAEKESRRVENESFIKSIDNNTSAINSLISLLEKDDKIGE